MECGSYLWKEAGKRLHFLRNSRDTEEGVRGWVLILGKRAVSQLEMATIRVSVTWWITETPPPPTPSPLQEQKVLEKIVSVGLHTWMWRAEEKNLVFIHHPLIKNSLTSNSSHVRLAIYYSSRLTSPLLIGWIHGVPCWCASCVRPLKKKTNLKAIIFTSKRKCWAIPVCLVFLFKLISICASFQILLHIIPQSPSIDCCSPWSTLHSGFGVLFLSEFALINNTFNQWRLVTSFCTPFHLNRGVTPDRNPWRQDLSSCTVVHFLSSGVFPAFDKLALHCTWEWEGVEWQWELKWKS